MSFSKERALCTVCNLLNLASHITCENGCGKLRGAVLFEHGISTAICPTCSSYYLADTTVCKKDNTPLGFAQYTDKVIEPNLEIPICPNCLASIDPNSIFCPFCGYLIKIKFRFTHEPLIPITLIANGWSPRFDYAGISEVHCCGLVDSGASKNLFPLEFAWLLGLDLSRSHAVTFSGIVSDAEITGYQATVTIGIGRHECQTIAYFSDNFSLTNGGLLGRDGFHDRFSVNIEMNNIITLSSEKSLRQQRYKFCPVCGKEATNTKKTRVANSE